jgi:uncharacterized Fe-S center protein
MVVLSHFKGHEFTGFGGAIKNMGMGCGSRAGKLAMHSDVRPRVSTERCIGCAKCVSWCPVKAISLKRKKASIAPEICIGCAECIVVCPESAIKIQWGWSTAKLQEKMAEYAVGTAKTKPRRLAFINFITDVSPQCDCYPFSDTPIVPDVGILLSTDPVAIDKASVDLINKQPGIKGSALKSGRKATDKFRNLYRDVDWRIQIGHARSLGLGTTSYSLVKV